DTQIGLIAQELEEHFPHLVNTDSEGYKSIQYGKLSAVLLEGMKEQQQEIEELKARIEILENK
ncbi:MAG: tail fiber domain-containing protein, partial [Patescibacteria group bacterium]|nr:tail fiber domain-containing protein [Patescibacteria group bacterium]